MTTPGCTGYGCRSQNIIDYVVAYQKKNVTPPSMREISAATGYSLAWVHETIKRMEGDGRVERRPGQARNIKIVSTPIDGPRDRRNEL